MANNESIDILRIESATELADKVAMDIHQRLAAAIEQTGEASLVVSGGGTPKPMFKALSAMALQWDKVTVTLADERWVPESDADSNAAFVKNTLLQNEAASARFVSLYVDETDADEGVVEVDKRVQTIAQPFTVVVLGMGGDGHTASLFPGAKGTDEAFAEKTRLVAIVDPETVPQRRITLTYAALMNTDCQMLHITGGDKRQILDEVLQDPEASGFPIARFLGADNTRMTVYTTD